MARIYMLGDSHTFELGKRLRDLLGEHDFTYQAFTGQGTAVSTRRATIPHPLDLAIVALGGNDFGDRSSERAELVRQLQATGARVLWFGPAFATRGDVDARHLRQTRDQAAQLPSLGVSYYDSRPLTTSGHRADGVHFTGTGYSAWASRMASAVRSQAASAGAAGGALVALAVAGVAFLLWRRRTR